MASTQNRILMESHNLIVVTEFILMGITYHPEMQAPLFGLFLIIYLITLVGNLGMIILTMLTSRLQTPVYVFVRQLSVTDLGYSKAVGPKMLRNFIVDQNIISFHFCATQLSFFNIVIVGESFILFAMSFDHYVAIFKPLLYNVIMSQRVFWVLVAVPYRHNVFLAFIVTINIFSSSFHGHNVTSHSYCDGLLFTSLLCSNRKESEVMIFILSIIELISSPVATLASYLLILRAILRMNSAEGRHKAFSTCRSHVTVVTVFYGTLIFMYVQPKSSHSFNTDKVTSIFYILVIPMLNPLIYSLKTMMKTCP